MANEIPYLTDGNEETADKSEEEYEDCFGGEDSEFFGFESPCAQPTDSTPFASPWQGPTVP